MNLLNNHRYALITGIVIAVVLALLIGGPQFNQLGLARWFHIVAGVFWIGLLYYFNVAQTPALADAAAERGGREAPSEPCPSPAGRSLRSSATRASPRRPC